MMFIWRNDDGLWPFGHIVATGEDFEDARKNTRGSVDYTEEVKTRMANEDPIRTFKD